MTMNKIYLYTRYERLWHWLQMALIVILMITGFEVNGVYKLFGYKTAVRIHSTAGVTWLISFLVFVFWLFTTGEWRQYIPTTRQMLDVILYYSWGIFKGDTHPFHKRKEAKHNPLQRISYLILASLLLPFQMVTGFLYWQYHSLGRWHLGFIKLQAIATAHLALTFAILLFVIIHVYMTTTGHTVAAHIRSMITGWEEASREDGQGH